jgi:hypothetical protein
MLMEIAARRAAERAPPLQLKRIHVLAALEVEALKAAALGVPSSDAAGAAATLLGGATARTGAGTGTTAAPGRGRSTTVAGLTRTAAAATTLAGVCAPALMPGLRVSHGCHMYSAPRRHAQPHRGGSR